MSMITTHVLDTVLGSPAAGIVIRLEARQESGTLGRFVEVARSITDADGRCRDLAVEASEGVYRLGFETGAYLMSKGRSSIYPEISITFACDGREHYHLPLLLSDNSYTTYRGS
jgi:5-hydroxyisourate hydrolase